MKDAKQVCCLADVYLPDCIIQNILAQLPTKPLARCKCVSKHWGHLISDHYFMKLRSRRMIILPTYPIHAVDNTLTNDDMAHSMIKIDCFDGNPIVRIVGTFNGIVFLLARQGENRPYSLILFNPFTRASEVVPESPWRSYAHESYNHYGLGYGTNPDDLKIVRLKSYLGEADRSSSFDVFSIKHRSWCKPSKLTGDYDFHNKNSGTFVNGFLYWIAIKKLERNSIIVAVNVQEMTFSEIHIPQKGVIRLGIFNGCLCMIINTNDFELELHVMNQHGFDKSWSKVLLVTLISMPFHAHKILCILDNGKLLLWCSSSQLIIYDMLNNSYKKVNAVTSCGRIGTQEAMEYVESLMSPANICSG